MLIGRLARGTGVLLCAAILVGTASAGDPPKQDPPGNSGSAPGQQKKADPVPAPPPAPTPTPAEPTPASANTTAPPAARAHAPDKPGATKNAAAKNARAAEKAARAEPEQEKKKPGSSSKGRAVAAQRGSSQGRSAEAHHHVIVCHRTGSASNPYVVINIPLTAWHEAHSPSTGSHPPLDGRSDVLLKDPASRPGSKDGFTKADCPGGAPAAPAARQPSAQQEQAKGQEHVLICHRTGSESNPYVIINIARPGWESGHRDHEGDVLLREGVRPGEKETAADAALAERSCRAGSSIVVTATPPATPAVPGSGVVAPVAPPLVSTLATLTTAATVTTATQAVAGAAGQPAAAQPAAAQPPAAQTAADQPQATQVAAAVSPRAETKRDEAGASGVLGAVQQAAAKTLPFTGIPLWIVALLAVSSLVAGIAIRRAAART